MIIKLLKLCRIENRANQCKSFDARFVFENSLYFLRTRIHHVVFNNFIALLIDIVVMQDCTRTVTELITFFGRSSCYTLCVFQAIRNTRTRSGHLLFLFCTVA